MVYLRKDGTLQEEWIRERLPLEHLKLDKPNLLTGQSLFDLFLKPAVPQSIAK